MIALGHSLALALLPQGPVVSMTPYWALVAGTWHDLGVWDDMANWRDF